MPRSQITTNAMASSLLYGLVMSSRASIIVVFALASACGGIADLPDGGLSDSGPAPLDKSCPTTMPAVNDACGKEGLACEYGDDSRWTCNTIVSCANGKWDAVFPPDGLSCPSKSDSTCPASLAAVDQGGACPKQGATCDYSTSAQSSWCTCGFQGGPVMINDGGPQFDWACSFGTSGCPAARPRIGTTCTQPNNQCDYSVCGLPSGLSVQCDPNLGTWVVGMDALCAKAN